MPKGVSLGDLAVARMRKKSPLPPADLSPARTANKGLMGIVKARQKRGSMMKRASY